MSAGGFDSTPESRAALERMERQELAEYEVRRKAKIATGVDPGEPAGVDRRSQRRSVHGDVRVG